MRLIRFILVIFIFAISQNLSGNFSGEYLFLKHPVKGKTPSLDTLRANQQLFNGRIWRNLYYTVEGHQFLFSDSFLTGSLVVRGKEFPDITLKYDAFKDEILIPLNTGRILQLNKEMVDSFTIIWQNKKYLFIKPGEDLQMGYLNVIYSSKTALYVKYTKRIELLADQGKFDRFYQTSQTYYVRDGIVYPIDSKRDLIKVLKDDKELIRSFLRKNKLKISKTNPETFIPLIQFLDSKRQ